MPYSYGFGEASNRMQFSPLVQNQGSRIEDYRCGDSGPPHLLGIRVPGRRRVRPLRAWRRGQTDDILPRFVAYRSDAGVRVYDRAGVFPSAGPLPADEAATVARSLSAVYRPI